MKKILQAYRIIRKVKNIKIIVYIIIFKKLFIK